MRLMTRVAVVLAITVGVWGGPIEALEGIRDGVKAPFKVYYSHLAMKRFLDDYEDGNISLLQFQESRERCYKEIPPWLRKPEWEFDL